MISCKKNELDDVLTTVLGKIDAGTVTCEDFNGLIGKTIIGETTPESVRDRLRRRTIRNNTASHLEPETGHQPLTLPVVRDRLQPKRKPEHQQNHGRAAIAHQHSARQQAQDQALVHRFQPALEFIRKYKGQPLTEELLALISDRDRLRSLATKLITRPGVDRDWLYDLVIKLG
jgi:hypothetical protein